MPTKRKTHTAEFKVKVALDAIRGAKTAAELASQYQIHPVQITQWKKQAIEGLPDIFQRGKPKPSRSEADITSPLYEEIDRLKMELDWLKKNLPSCSKDRQKIIETQLVDISIRRQCLQRPDRNPPRKNTSDHVLLDHHRRRKKHCFVSSRRLS